MDKHEKALREIIAIWENWEDNSRDGMREMRNTAWEALGPHLCTRSMYHDGSCNGLPNKGCSISHYHRDNQDGTGPCLDCGMSHPKQPITARKVS